LKKKKVRGFGTRSEFTGVRMGRVKLADLRVRIICRLETEILDTHFLEEYTHESCVPHRKHDAPHESMSARGRTNQIGKC